MPVRRQIRRVGTTYTVERGLRLPRGMTTGVHGVRSRRGCNRLVKVFQIHAPRRLPGDADRACSVGVEVGVAEGKVERGVRRG